jgi:hypothetical protein
MLGGNAGRKEAAKIKTRESAKRERLSADTDITTRNIIFFYET